MTGTVVSITEYKLIVNVGLLAAETVNTEVVGIVEVAPVPHIGNPVFPDSIRDHGRDFTQELCCFAEGFSFIEGLFNKNAVIQGKMLMGSQYQSFNI